MTRWSFLAVLHLLSVTCFDLSILDLSGNQQVTTVTLHAFLGAAAIAPERNLTLYIGGKCYCVSNASTKVVIDIHVTYKRGGRDVAMILCSFSGVCINSFAPGLTCGQGSKHTHTHARTHARMHTHTHTHCCNYDLLCCCRDKHYI